MRGTIFAISALIVLAFSSLAGSAHSPLGTGENVTLAAASEIPDPAKSWAIYSNLDEEHLARYYVFEIDEGERIYVNLIISSGSKNAGFLPRFALMGPNLTDENVALMPSWVERLPDDDNGIIVIDSELPSQGTFEPFSPSGYYEIGEIDIDAPATGDYYIIVFDEAEIGGNFGLAVGYLESFTIDEWLFLSFALISVYEWTGMDIVIVLAPIIAVIVLGMSWLYWRHRKGETPKLLAQWMAGIAGILALSWGTSVAFQMLSALTYTMLGSEIVITIGFAAISFLIGTYMLKIALRDQARIPVRSGILLIVFGGLMIAFLSGFLIGPIMAIASGASSFIGKNKR